MSLLASIVHCSGLFFFWFVSHLLANLALQRHEQLLLSLARPAGGPSQSDMARAHPPVDNHYCIGHP
jgi:hypothetical protein